jgi:hypothetical protein
VLDCPPALDLLTLNALVAADAVLIPMQAEYFALEGISELLDTVERIRASFNPALEIEGVVLTMFDERTNLAQQVTAELKRFFGEKLCRTTIPRNIRLAEAPSHGKAALVYDPRSRGAESYIRLAKEIIAHHLPAEVEDKAAAAAAESMQSPVAAESTDSAAAEMPEQPTEIAVADEAAAPSEAREAQPEIHEQAEAPAAEGNHQDGNKEEAPAELVEIRGETPAGEGKSEPAGELDKTA